MMIERHQPALNINTVDGISLPCAPGCCLLYQGLARVVWRTLRRLMDPVHRDVLWHKQQRQQPLLAAECAGRLPLELCVWSKQGACL
jgi:hypothetical protein